METSTAFTTTKIGEYVGKHVKYKGKEYRVTEIGPTFAICVLPSDVSKTIRIRTKELQQARMKHVLASFTPTKRQKFPLEFIEYVVERLHEANQQQQERKARQKLIKRVKEQRRCLEGKQKTLDSRDESGKEITQKSLDSQFENLEKREDSLAELPEIRKRLTKQEILKDIERVYGVNIPHQRASDWMKGQGRRNYVGGRPAALPEDVESNIIDAILHLDSIGFSITCDVVLDLVDDYVGEDFKKRFKNDVATSDWFKRFFARAKKKNPDIVTAIEQRCDSARDDWYNSANINWWFDTVKKRLLELGVVEVVDDADDSKELRWLFPERVIITDETKVPGDTDKRKNEPKLITTKQHLNEDKKRAKSAPKERDEHITLLAGHSLTGDTTPPAWVLPLKNKPSDDVVIEMLKVVPTSNTLGKANGHTYHDPIVSNSEEGSVVKGNIQEIMEKLIGIMFPDANDDDPSKRVIWFTDWHGSRCSSEFIKWLWSKGVYLFGWLPNCISLMQSPDTNLFGPLKQVYMAMKRKEFRSVSITRYQRIEFMGKALAKVGTKKRYLEGAKVTGMLPFSRQTLLKKVQTAAGDKKRAQKRKAKGKTLLSSIHSSVSPTANAGNTSSDAQEDATNITSPTAESVWSSISQRHGERGMELGPIASWKTAALTPMEITEKKEKVLARVEKFKGKLKHVENQIDLSSQKRLAELEQQRLQLEQQLERQKQQVESATRLKKAKLEAEAAFCDKMKMELNNEQPSLQLQSTVAMCWESISDMDKASRSSWTSTNQGPGVEAAEVEGCDTSVITNALNTTAVPCDNKPKKYSYRPWYAGNLIRHAQTVEVTSSPNKRRIEELEAKRDAENEAKRAKKEAAEAKKQAANEKAEQKKTEQQQAVSNWLQSVDGKYPGAPALKAWLKQQQVKFEAANDDDNLNLVKSLLQTNAKQYKHSKQQFLYVNK